MIGDMADIATNFLGFDVGADYALGAAGLAEDDGLETAVILSLFTDRRANEDDTPPGDPEDRRGWFGDGYADIAGDQIGSRLWLLSREKQTAPVLMRARQYAQESLAWLVEDGIASQVEVEAFVPRDQILALSISITRPAKAPVRYRFDGFWNR